MELDPIPRGSQPGRAETVNCPLQKLEPSLALCFGCRDSGVTSSRTLTSVGVLAPAWSVASGVGGRALNAGCEWFSVASTGNTGQECSVPHVPPGRSEGKVLKWKAGEWRGAWTFHFSEVPPAVPACPPLPASSHALVSPVAGR